MLRSLTRTRPLRQRNASRASARRGWELDSSSIRYMCHRFSPYHFSRWSYLLIGLNLKQRPSAFSTSSVKPTFSSKKRPRSTLEDLSTVHLSLCCTRLTLATLPAAAQSAQSSCSVVRPTSASARKRRRLMYYTLELHLSIEILKRLFWNSSSVVSSLPP